MIVQVLFYIFSALAVFSALLVVTRRNPVNAGVSLLRLRGRIEHYWLLKPCRHRSSSRAYSRRTGSLHQAQ